MKKRTKVFTTLEIETRGLSTFPKIGECPINTIAILDTVDMKIYTGAVNDTTNKSMQEFINHGGLVSGYMTHLLTTDHRYSEFSYELKLFTSEEELIKWFWDLNNELKRDDCFSWGGLDYEYPTILERMKVLGISKSVSCIKNSKIEILEIVRTPKGMDVYDNNDFLSCMSHTSYTDSLRKYVNINRTTTNLKRFDLPTVMHHETDFVHFERYKSIKTVGDFPFTDYTLFVFCNLEALVSQYVLYEKLFTV